jgi:hypothetical protein
MYQQEENFLLQIPLWFLKISRVFNLKDLAIFFGLTMWTFLTGATTMIHIDAWYNVYISQLILYARACSAYDYLIKFEAGYWQTSSCYRGFYCLVQSQQFVNPNFFHFNLSLGQFLPGVTRKICWTVLYTWTNFHYQLHTNFILFYLFHTREMF